MTNRDETERALNALLTDVRAVVERRAQEIAADRIAAVTVAARAVVDGCRQSALELEPGPGHVTLREVVARIHALAALVEDCPTEAERAAWAAELALSKELP
jgi:hypothetical protein